MSLCKNCGHHARHDRVPGQKSEQWPEPVACTFESPAAAKGWKWCSCTTFLPDESPQGQLIAAALEIGKRAETDELFDNPGKDYPRWLGWIQTNQFEHALMLIRDAERGEAS